MCIREDTRAWVASDSDYTGQITMRFIHHSAGSYIRIHTQIKTTIYLPGGHIHNHQVQRKDTSEAQFILHHVMKYEALLA